jgi:hypothetical protein
MLRAESNLGAFHVRHFELTIEAVIPLGLKVVYTLFVFGLVPIYWRQYGPVNFLWFSDIALLALVPGLWLENALLISMMAVSVVFFEALWNIDFFFRLVTGKSFHRFECLYVRRQNFVVHSRTVRFSSCPASPTTLDVAPAWL